MRDMVFFLESMGGVRVGAKRHRKNRVGRERRALIGLPEIRQAISGKAMAQFPLPDPMRRALDLARIAAEWGEVPVGAVVVKDGQVIAEGHNRPRESHDPTAHAEIVAIRLAAAKLGNERLDGCDLYVTLEPCAMCAGAIAHARMARLYYGADDPKGGAVVHGPRVFSQPTVHHRPEIYDGIGANEAAALLRDFFAARR
jgi:tRNA(adenine34) deaminase